MNDALAEAGEEFLAVHPDAPTDPAHPEIGNWKSSPGEFNDGLEEFVDVYEHYPQVVSYSVPAFTLGEESADPTETREPGHQGIGGWKGRRSLLGMMAPGGTNLLEASASGFEPDSTVPYDFADIHCDDWDDPATPYWDGLPQGVRIGGMTDAEDLWWNCRHTGWEQCRDG